MQRQPTHTLVMLALLCVGSWSVDAPVCAAFAPTILLVHATSVPRAQIDAVASMLGTFAELVDPQEYLAACAAERLAPTSEHALTDLAPNVHVRMIAVLTNPRGRLLVDFRDGRTLATLDGAVLARTRGRLTASAIGQVRAAAERALATLQPQPIAADGGEAAAPLPSVAPDSPPAARIEAPPAEPPLETIPPEAGAASLSDRDAAPPPSVTGSRFTAAISFGPGFAQRSLQLPARDGTRSLTSKLFPALDLRVAAESVLAADFALGLRFDYQTSLGLHAYQILPDRADPRETSLRSHHLVFGIAPRIRFAGSDDGVSLALLLGWGFRGLRPVSVTEWPPYTLDGPVLRPELRIAIGDRVALRLAPEFFVVTSVTTELRRLAAAGGTGLGLGVEAALDISLARRFGLTIAYRESDVTLATNWGPKLRDRERFATVAAVLKY